MPSLRLVALLIALLVSVSILGAQTATLRGRVLDSSGGVMIGADVRIFSGDDVVLEGKTTEAGGFALDVAPGEYRLEVTAPGFSPHGELVRITPDMQPLLVTLGLAAVATVVDVRSESNELTVDPLTSLTSTIIAGDALLELPDNEEDLIAFLQQVAGGLDIDDIEFIIDGFTGGRLPARDQIQQIVIDNNPFFAGSRGGGPRVEIVTRAGTGEWGGAFGLTFQDNVLNARNPFDANKAARQQRNFTTTVSGPLIPNRLSISFNGRSNETQAEGASINAATPSETINRNVPSPIVSRDLNTRGQLFLTTSNTLTFNVGYNTNKRENQGVGGFNLPERAFNGTGSGWQLQLSERAILGSNKVNEVRFGVNRDNRAQTPVTDGAAINVLDAFFGGGAQNRSSSELTRYQAGNTFRWTVSRQWNIQTGMEFTYNRRHSISEDNYAGTFVFSSLDDYLSGRPLSFTQRSGDPRLEVSQSDFNAFLQADWRLRQNVSIGLGLRYEAQTNLPDYNNFAPMLSLAYQPRQGTVIRMGSRISYSGFGLNSFEQLLRDDGAERQFETVILNPPYPNPFADGDGAASPLTSSSIRSRADDFVSPYGVNSSISWDQELTGGFRTSVSFDNNIGLRELRTGDINAPYPGAPLPEDLQERLGSSNPVVQSAALEEVNRMRPLYPDLTNIYQFESVGRLSSRGLSVRIMNMNPNSLTSSFSIGGAVNYRLGWSYDDGGIPANHYDRAAEWARSSQDIRHRIQGGVFIRMPWTTSANLNIIANSGRPYTITTGRDDNADTQANDRPACAVIASHPLCAGISLDHILPRHTETGASSYNVNMNFSKIFHMRRETTPAPATGVGRQASSLAQGPGGGGGTGAVIIGPGGGQGGGGVIIGPGGGQGGGGVIIGPGGGGPVIVGSGGAGGAGLGQSGPALIFSVLVSNLLNNTQLQNYSGVMTSPFFGQATNAGRGRQITLSMNVRF